MKIRISQSNLVMILEIYEFSHFNKILLDSLNVSNTSHNNI